jgi:tetratricopeptide (TPR) repeat protein
MTNNTIPEIRSEAEVEKANGTKHIPIAVTIAFVLMFIGFFIYILYVNMKSDTKDKEIQTAQQPSAAVSPEQQLVNCLKIVKTDSSEMAFFNLGLAYVNNKMYGESIKIYKKVLTINPSNVTANNNLGFAYGCLSDWDNGIKYCQIALKLDPNFQLAKNNLNWMIGEKAKAGK